MEEQTLSSMSKPAERILEYLRSHGDISPIEAFMECDCGFLSTVVEELEQLGYEIRTRAESYTNNLGGQTPVTRYVLVAGPSPQNDKE